MDAKSKKISWLLILLLWYVLMVYFVTPILVEYMFLTNSVIAELFAEIISVCLPILTVLLIAKQDKSSMIPLFRICDVPMKMVTSRKLLLWIMVIVAISISVNYTFNIFEVIYIIVTKNYSIISYIPEFDIVVFLFTVLVVAIIPSIFEELCYRCMYYDCLYDTNWVLLYIITSLIFASLHVNIYSFINAFILGIFLMICYQQNKSLKLIVLLHFVNNLISIVLSNIVTLPLSPLRILEDYANDNQMIAAVIYYIGVVLFMLIILLFCINKLELRNVVLQNENKISILSIILILLLIVISVGLFIIKIIY